MAPSRAGQRFGHYELRSSIGVGGMGEVYLAYDVVKQRTVALKLLRTELATDPDFQERFRRESRIAAQLNEPHVIPVHDFGEIDGVLYIDMRVVEGDNLKAVIARDRRLDPVRATSIVAQVAAALDAAHDSGLTHRDIKPENILLTSSEFAYLVDFGIARFDGDTGLTSAGSAVGSSAYMAPERFTKGQSGPPADVYSLTCVLYETLTGEPPFAAAHDLTQLMSAHILWPPPRPSAVCPGLNPTFDRIIAWGLAKDPAARCPSAGELARAATAAATNRPPIPAAEPTRVRPAAPEQRPYVETPARSGGSGKNIALAAAIGVAVLAAVVAAVSWITMSDRSTHATAPLVPVTSTRSVQATESPTEAPATTSSRRAVLNMPGTDEAGFLAYPAARCDTGDRPAAMGLTARSALIVCSTESGANYYRGVRLSDNASIQLDGATPTAGGFDVVNPSDGTRYQIRPGALTIATPGKELYSEPMVEYASA